MSEYDDILDAVDKKTGSRTCPECGYQFHLFLFVKRYVMKFGFSKWKCPSCQKSIKYNYTKSNLIGAVGFIICVFGFQILPARFGMDLPNFSFLIPYFVFLLVQLNFDKLEKY